MKQVLLFALFFILTPSLFGQSIDEKLTTHQEAYHLEKIYISHNQPHYAPGDTLYGKLFLVNGRSHQYFEGTPIVYLDWLTESDGTKASYILKVKKGTANISIPIKRDYGEGRFLLRAYTQYQKNFDDGYIFQKEIKVIGEKPLTIKNKTADKKDYSLQFFPEGGYLVNGLSSTLAFQAMDEDGKPIDISGVILNKNKEEIGQLKSLNEGIGIFNFKPEKGQSYQAKLEWEGLKKFIKLPTALKEGYVLKINNRKRETISLQLLSNTSNGLKGCKLVGHLRGNPFLNQVLKEGTTQKLLLNKLEIPSGILHFTLFDAQNRPVSERLVFNNNPTEEVAVSISVPTTYYGVKELVKGKVIGKLGEKIATGDLSIAVYNKDIFPDGIVGANIKNYLLLQSDLKGRINNINQYFEKNDAKSRTLLDYVMLTHGWRRFNWQEVLQATPTPIIYPTEENISFAGKIMKDNKQDKPVKGDVYLSILNKDNFTSTNLTTTEDGLFHFKGFDLPDSTEILIQGNIYNGKKKNKLKKGEAKRTGNKNVKFEVINLHELAFRDSITLKSIPYEKTKQQLFTTEVSRIRKIDTIYHPEWSINLEAVTVKASRMDEKRKRDQETKKMLKERGFFYSDESQKIYTDDLIAGGAIYTSIYEIIRSRVPGARITRISGLPQILLRGQSSITIPTYAIIKLNGLTLDALAAESIDPNTIALIDVKRGLSETSIYGEEGKGGVISIFTKEPGTNKRTPNVSGILTINHPGYHKARTFYTPDYGGGGVNKDRPDYRTTLYWNPDLKLGKTPTSFQFYTGDKLSQFIILVEGITEEGIPFVGKSVIQVGG